MAPINSSNNKGISTIAQQALQIAQSQIGECERPKGSNSGPMVNEYLKSVGLNSGYAWCQAFVYWCYEQATMQLSPNPVVRTPGVIDCWNRTAVQFKISAEAAIRTPALLKPGYQFILSFGKGAGHTGIIERVEGDVLYTIEGNSNTNGSREGYEVVRHQRNLNDTAFLGFIKY